MPAHRPAAERFWSKVEATAPDSCWLWMAATDRGYGRFGVTSGRMVAAHRWSYEQVVGPISEGLTLDHLCRVRNCVNPAHLEPVTLEENLARIPARTHCPKGHAYNEANTYYSPPNPNTGRRTATCRTCNREKQRARNERIRAERAA